MCAVARGAAWQARSTARPRASRRASTRWHLPVAYRRAIRHLLSTTIALTAATGVAAAQATLSPSPGRAPSPASATGLPSRAATPTVTDTTPAATDTAPAATAPNEPDIARPAPDAPPRQVDDATAIARAAALTPLLPHPDEPTRPAFLLYAEIDLPILAVGAVFALGRRARTEPAFCAPACDRVKLNALDKLTAGYYSTRWSLASDYLLAGLGAGAAALLIANDGVLGALNDAVVIGEATLGATALASIMTLAAGRPRPFLYGDPGDPDGYKAPLRVRTSSDAGLSFLSSHTTAAFAIVTSLYIAERRLRPRSSAPRLILGAGLAVASAVAAARVMAGYHFITDVVGGAVVGASLGVLVASVHGSPVRVVPVIDRGPSGGHAGAALQGTF